VQSKWIHSGTGEPENGDIKKFVAGIRDLVNLSFDRFNDKIKAKRDLLEKTLYDSSTRYEAIIVYPSINKLSEPSARDLHDLAAEMNDPTDMLTVTPFIQGDLFRSLTVGISGEPINLEIILNSWGKRDTPRPAIYGQVDGQQIGSWWEKNRTRLFVKNLRGVLGDTDVNNEIRDTIERNPEHFWYFNNGITIIAQKITKAAAGGGDNAFGVFHCKNVSIVNGAQTVGAIGKYAESGKDNHHKISVAVRIISLEESQDDFGIPSQRPTTGRTELKTGISLRSIPSKAGSVRNWQSRMSHIMYCGRRPPPGQKRRSIWWRARQHFPALPAMFKWSCS